MLATWSGGLGAAVRWLGVFLWHVAQEPDSSGSWQPMQCVLLAPPQEPECDSGRVSWWQRSQDSARWQAEQLSRSMLAWMPCPRSRNWFVWLAGWVSWWHVWQDCSVWHSVQSWTRSSGLARKIDPWTRIQFWLWVHGAWSAAYAVWQVVHSLGFDRTAWQSTQASIDT